MKGLVAFVLVSLCLTGCRVHLKHPGSRDPVDRTFTLSEGELHRLVRLARQPPELTHLQLRQLVVQSRSGDGDDFKLEPENNCVIIIKPKLFPAFKVEYNFATGSADAPIVASLKEVEVGLEVEKLDGSFYPFDEGDSATIQITGLYSGSASRNIEMFVAGGSSWIELANYHHTSDVSDVPTEALARVTTPDDPQSVHVHFHREGEGVSMHFRK